MVCTSERNNDAPLAVQPVQIPHGHRHLGVGHHGPSPDPKTGHFYLAESGNLYLAAIYAHTSHNLSYVKYKQGLTQDAQPPFLVTPASGELISPAGRSLALTRWLTAGTPFRRSRETQCCRLTIRHQALPAGVSKLLFDPPGFSTPISSRYFLRLMT